MKNEELFCNFAAKNKKAASIFSKEETQIVNKCNLSNLK